MNDFKVYILWSETIKKYYVGSTGNLPDRLKRHNTGKSRFTSKGLPWVMVVSFDCVDRKEAVQLEMQIKKRGIKRFLEDRNIK